MNRLWKVAIAAVALWALPRPAAAYQEVVEVIRSTATVGGIVVTTGTAVQVDIAPHLAQGTMGSGYNRANIRIQNHNSTYAIFCGFASTVSATAGSAHLGEKIPADGGNVEYPHGRDIKHFCICESGAGATGCQATVKQAGYR